MSQDKNAPKKASVTIGANKKEEEKKKATVKAVVKEVKETEELEEQEEFVTEELEEKEIDSDDGDDSDDSDDSDDGDDDDGDDGDDGDEEEEKPKPKAVKAVKAVKEPKKATPKAKQEAEPELDENLEDETEKAQEEKPKGKKERKLGGAALRQKRTFDVKELLSDTDAPIGDIVKEIRNTVTEAGYLVKENSLRLRVYMKPEKVVKPKPVKTEEETEEAPKKKAKAEKPYDPMKNNIKKERSICMVRFVNKAGSPALTCEFYEGLPKPKQLEVTERGEDNKDNINKWIHKIDLESPNIEAIVAEIVKH